MKRPITNALVTLMMVFIVATNAHAVTLARVHKFDTAVDKCGVCHASYLGSTAAATNVCLVCHKAGSAYSVNKQFFKGDMANPFGTTVEDESSGTYTHSSHEWSATDNNPAAGALPPINPSMYTVQSYIGLLSCNRCHAIHSDPVNTPELQPLLRVSKANDTMCLDCHRLRNSQTHLNGTHPVNINYTSIAKAKPTKFAPLPVNSNPANPSSAMRLNNGQVICTTCHGIHYTDSNSKTFDNRTTAIMGGLSPSKGFLLRTDYRSDTVDGPLICTNCHINKNSHKGGTQRVICTDCHSGHVDYDPNAFTDQDRIPNVYMVKRYMNWSSPTGWRDNRKLATPKQTFYQYTGSQRLYKRADGKGICQGCHDVPAAGLAANGITYPAQHGTTNLEDAPRSVCNGCHAHQGPSAFSPNCSGCHGQPPTASTPAPGYGGTEGTAHTRHAGGGSSYAYGCDQCHYPGNNSLHENGNFQNVFNAGYTTGITASKFGASPKYNTATGTCSTTYCHSNGAPQGLPFKMYTSPVWFSGSIATCDKCHEAQPTTNAHGKHLAKGYSCENCHGATASGSTAIKDKTKHADGNKDIAFSSVGLPVVIAGSSCSTVYCHSDGNGNYAAPAWTVPSSGACGTCHATSDRTTDAHQQHLALSVAYGPQLNSQPTVAAACNTCHGPDYTTNHINGQIDSATANNSCASSCHKNGGVYAVNWKLAGRLTCESCHTLNLSVIAGVTAPAKDQAATQGHGKPVSSVSGVTMNYSCTTCHDPNAPHINPAVNDTRLVANLTASFNAQCNYCHNDAAKVTTSSRQNMSTHVLDKNATPTASSCSACHDLHGTDNKAMIRMTINGQTVVYNDTVGFITTVKNANGKYAGFCQVCHTLTAHYTNTTLDTHNISNPKGCLSCHKHNTATYAFKPAGGCDACHGYPPVQSIAGIGTQGNYSGARLDNYSGGGGAHNVAGHLLKTVSPSEGFANCLKCHFGADLDHSTRDYTKPSNIRVNVDPQYKFNSLLQIRYSSNQVDPPLRNSTGSCSNVSCHFQPTPRWSQVR